jgi:hypothetical protein
MEQSRLRARTGMRYELLNPILEELAREGKIKMTAGKQGDQISLKNDEKEGKEVEAEAKALDFA